MTMERYGERRVPGNEAVIAAVEETMDKHVEEFHAFRAPELREMVREHRALIDTLHGERHPTAADPDHRIGGMAEKVDRIEKLVSNGGIKTQIPTRLYVTIIGTGGAVLVGLLTVINSLIESTHGGTP